VNNENVVMKVNRMSVIWNFIPKKNGRYMDYNSTSFIIAGDVGNQVM
jgi:hypothetical protein